MTFRATATAAAIIALALGLMYLVAGHLLVQRWQVVPTEGVLLMGRRMGAVYLGLSVMFFATRSAAPSPARSGISAGTAVALVLLAALGVYEFAMGRAGPAILASVAVELLLAIGFARAFWKDRVAGEAPAGAGGLHR